MRLEHINLTVSDLDRACAFYTQLFDLELQWEGTVSSCSKNGRTKHLAKEGCYLALFETPQQDKAPVDYVRAGFNHFGIVVDDLDEIETRLRKLGTNPLPGAEYEPGRRLYAFDPDGIEIEFVEYAT
ncbi:MAG: VOC family protein [Pseudomonadota bacterium]